MFESIIHRLQFQYLLIPCLDRRLAQQTKLLKERNATLLRAVGSVKGGSNGGGGSGEEYVWQKFAYSRTLIDS